MKESRHDRRQRDRAASGAPEEGWAVGDRFSWEEIHSRLLAAADEEIASKPRELLFSGLTAGFAIVLTVIGFSVGLQQFPDNPFLAALLSPIGFIYIILGRYQLYTENTLPPVKLVLTRMAGLPLLLRLWGIVLAANVAGAGLGAAALAWGDVLAPAAMDAAGGALNERVSLSWGATFFRALFAGWLVAGAVWINAGARDTASRLMIIYFVFYTLAVCDLFHVVPAVAEAFLAVFSGRIESGPVALFAGFCLPVLLGNTAGGVLVFAFIAYAQSTKRRYPEVRVLEPREVLFSMKGGEPHDWREKKAESKIAGIKKGSIALPFREWRFQRNSLPIHENVLVEGYYPSPRRLIPGSQIPPKSVETIDMSLDIGSPPLHISQRWGQTTGGSGSSQAIFGYRHRRE